MQKQFDYIIYGATLEGLLTGHYLHQKGFKTLVLEPSDKVGGFFASVETAKATIPSVFTTPSYDESLALAEWIKSNLSLSENLEVTKESLPPTTFEKGHFEPFVGFGENAPQESEYLQDFLSAHRMTFTPDVNTWIKTILTSGLEIRYNSNLTSINVENGNIVSFTINDKDELKSKNYIYAQNPAEIVEFFGVETTGAAFASQKALTRLSKGTFASTLQLSLIHTTPVTDKKEMHVLYGTQKNPVVSVGQFQGLTSQWVTFISADPADINEESVQILKEMKRQIKRAYPEALDNLAFEKIALWPQTHGYIELKSKQFGQLEGIDNISLCSNHLVENTNPFLGGLRAVQYTIDVLGGASPEAAQTDASESDSTETVNAWC